MLVEQTLFGTIDKVANAIALLKEHEPPEGYYLCFSGGKDSVTIKALAQMAGVKFDAHYNVTTVDPPQVTDFMKRYHPDVIWDYPPLSMAELIVKYKIPPMRNARYCCKALKKCNGQGRVKITGIRAAESRSRASKPIVDIVKGEKHINVIRDWETADIWHFIKDNHIPYCKLYDQGFDRIGCVLCPFLRKADIVRDLKLFPEIVSVYREACRKSFEVNHDKIKLVKKHAAYSSGDDIFNWWLFERRGKRDCGSLNLFEEAKL